MWFVYADFAGESDVSWKLFRSIKSWKIEGALFYLHMEGCPGESSPSRSTWNNHLYLSIIETTEHVSAIVIIARAIPRTDYD